MKFIELKTFNSKGENTVLVNLKNITFIEPDPELQYCTDLYFIDDNEPLVVSASYAEVKEILQNELNSDKRIIWRWVKNMDKIKRFREIVTEAADLYTKKNANYGDSFGDTWKKLGPISGITRMWDKMNRITSLIRGADNHFESLEDNLKDLICYSTMALIEVENDKLNHK